MEEILCSFDNNQLGCYVNSCFAGDLLVLYKIQLMLDVCCTVGSSYDLSFDPSKCLCSVFCTQNIKIVSSLSIFDTALKWYNKMTYLGTSFLFGCDLSVHILNRLEFSCCCVLY
jgi:hypothetical protein